MLSIVRTPAGSPSLSETISSVGKTLMRACS